MANLSADTTIGGKHIIDLIYPVGSWYYNSEDNTNPSELFGVGEWEPVAAGRVPVGVNPNDSDFENVEQTGGSKEHQLSEDEMPSHSHSVSEDTTGSHDHNVSTGSALGNHSHDIRTADSGGWDMNGGAYSSAYRGEVETENTDLNHSHTIYEDSTGDHNHNVSVGNTGGGNSHNNLQPYITVYIWKRVG